MAADYNRPLGQKVATRNQQSRQSNKQPARTDWGQNPQWDAVIPPSAETRNFNQPLGVKMAFRPEFAHLAEKMDAESDSVQGSVSQKGDPANTAGVSFLAIDKPRSGKSDVQGQYIPTSTIQFPILWYGAKITIEANEVVYQPANPARGIEGWLLVKLPVIDGETAWTPPVADLNSESDKIEIPEFICIINNKKLKCRHLNIELWNTFNMYLVFQVIEVL